MAEWTIKWGERRTRTGWVTNRCRIVAGPGNTVCTVHASTKQAERARLIAAAPELKSLVAQFVGVCGTRHWDIQRQAYEISDLVEKGRDLLSKAGEG